MAGIVIETVCAAIVVMPCVWLLGRWKRYSLKKLCAFLALALYLSGVYFLTGLPTLQFHTFDMNLNWIPFAGMVADVRNCLLNVVLFVPLGILLPVCWDRYRGFGSTIRFGASLSISIELLQLMTFRATDINDLITNTLGTVLGFWIWFVVSGKKIRSVGRQGELSALLGIVAVGMFFIQPYLVSFVYQWIP